MQNRRSGGFRLGVTLFPCKGFENLRCLQRATDADLGFCGLAIFEAAFPLVTGP